MTQILHRGTTDSGRWFTVSTVDCKDGQVNWFDSSFTDLDVDTKEQICAIMKSGGTTTFSKMSGTKSNGRH